MVDLQPISTPSNSSNTPSEQSSTPSATSPTSHLPTTTFPILPHFPYQPSSSTSFTPYHFQETMFFYFYPFFSYFYPVVYPQTTVFPVPPPCNGGPHLQHMVSDTQDNLNLLPPPPSSAPTRRSYCRRRTFQKNPKTVKWSSSTTQEWKPKQKVKPRKSERHASESGSHPRLPPPPSSAHLADCTTVMVKNIPNFLSRRELIDLLDQHCRQQNKDPNSSSSQYNFLYLPFDFKYKQNLGYAFVNFTTEEGASKLHLCWNGEGWSRSSKTRQITRARLQGLEMNKQHFQRSIFRCLSEDYLPVELSPPRNGFNADVCEMTAIGEWLYCNGAAITSSAKSWRVKTVVPPRLSH